MSITNTPKEIWINVNQIPYYQSDGSVSMTTEYSVGLSDISDGEKYYHESALQELREEYEDAWSIIRENDKRVADLEKENQSLQAKVERLEKSRVKLVGQFILHILTEMQFHYGNEVMNHAAEESGLKQWLTQNTDTDDSK